MRRTGVLALLILAVTTATAEGRHRCASAESRTVVSNAAVRVFEKTRTGRFYVCRYATGRKRFIGPDAEDLDNERLARFRLIGEFLAYERTFGPFRGEPTYEIVVRRAGTGRVVRRVDAAPREAPRGAPDPRDGVRDLVVTSRGALAWIVHNPYAAGPRTQVRRFDGDGPALVEADPKIAETSLALRGHTAAYRRGGLRRTVELKPPPADNTMPAT